jgi:HSP20 family protein
MASDDLIRLMQSLFLPVAGSFQELLWRPAADVYRTPCGWLIKLDLAGVPPEDVEVSVHGRRLTVRGERRDCFKEETCSHYLMEISYSHFERTVELPCDLSRAHVTTESRYGMLLVRIRMEEEP